MKKIFTFFGVDRSIAYTLLGRGWGILSGLITIWFISKFLTSAEQGYYYTFASILAMQILFELGLSYVVMQFASHEMACLVWTPEGVLKGDEKAKSRLHSLVVLVVKWYGAISILIVLGILPIGWIFFKINHYDANVTWRLAWVWLIVVAALNVFCIPFLAIFEGCGRMAEVARMRMYQNVVGSLSGWLVLVAGGGLLVVPVINTGMFVVAMLWLLLSKRKFFKDLLGVKQTTNIISWKTEIWPFQWKIALSWLSGYFIYQLFNPILFAYHGPVVAGQMGMSLSISGALSIVGMAWINTKAPVFGNMVVLKRFDELDTLFFQALSKSTFVVIVGGVVLSIGRWFLEYSGSHLSLRILPMFPFTLLIVIVIINQIVFSEAVYLRAHKQEPFVWLSVLSGVLISTTSLLFGKQYSATGMIFGYFLVAIVVGLGGGSWIFFQKKKEWHTTVAQIATCMIRDGVKEVLVSQEREE